MPTVEHETTIAHRLALLETAHAHTRDELQQLSEKVDDHHADTIERLDQMRSDLQHAIGKTDRRLKAVERFQQEALDHFAFLTSKVTEHDARFDRIDGRLDKVEGRLDRVEGRLDRVEGRLDKIEGRLDRIEGRLDAIEPRLDKVEAQLTTIDSKLNDVLALLTRH